MSGVSKSGAKKLFKGTTMHRIITDAVKTAKRTTDASFTEINAAVGKWLVGSRDRGGQSLQRLKTKLQAEDRLRDGGDTGHTSPQPGA